MDYPCYFGVDGRGTVGGVWEEEIEIGLSMDKKSVIFGALMGLLLPTIVGVFLLHYEYKILLSGALEGYGTYGNGGNSYLLKKERSIIIIPKKKNEYKPFLSDKRYYMSYTIKLDGGDMGFPNNTMFQVSAKVGKIIRFKAPEALRPRTHEGANIASWENAAAGKTPVVVFLDGPGQSIQATLYVEIMSIGKPLSLNDIKIIVDSKDRFETDVTYATVANWGKSKRTD